MSTIVSVLSSTKPVNPNPGSLFYFTDTNQIGIYQGGGVYYVYNKDTNSYSSGGEEQLNYPGGLFNSSSSDYYIGTAPEFHFDAEFVNGVEETALAEDFDFGSEWDFYTTGNKGWRNRGSSDREIGSPYVSTSPLNRMKWDHDLRAVFLNYGCLISGPGNPGDPATSSFSFNADKKWTIFMVAIPSSSGRLIGFANSSNGDYSPFSIGPGAGQTTMGGTKNWSMDANNTQASDTIVGGRLALYVAQCEGKGLYANWYTPSSESATTDSEGRLRPHITISAHTSYPTSTNIWGTGQGLVANASKWCEIIVYNRDITQEEMDITTRYLYNKHTNRIHSNFGATNKIIYDDPTTWKLFKKNVHYTAT